MKFIHKLCATLLSGALVALAAVPAVSHAAETVSVSNAWVRATAPGQKTAGAYMELTGSADAALIAVETPVAGKAELHSMSMEAGVMRMRPIGKIALPAKLAPGGLHVMLLDLRHPLKEGDRVPLTLTIRGAGGRQSTVNVAAEVRAVGGGAMRGH